MAVIHRTTLKPTKLELLTSWLPSRQWYLGAGEPALAKAGGFRLDDPAGEVGIEFMVITDTSGGEPISYLIPLTYRGVPLDGREHALIGTAEHGVLGRRWIYDGCHDPVLVAQVLALIEGRAQAQDQNTSNTPNREILRSYTGDSYPGDSPVPTDFTATAVDDRAATELSESNGATLRFNRVLHSTPDDASNTPPEATGHVTGAWRTPDGAAARGVFVVLRPGPRA